MKFGEEAKRVDVSRDGKARKELLEVALFMVIQTEQRRANK
jgi:hypothetical protein